MNQVKLGVLISGGGSNLQSIIDHIEDGTLSARINVVVSNEPDVYGLQRAQKHGLAHLVVNHRDFSSRDAFENRLIQVMEEHQVELVVLAGFMRLVTGTFLKAFPNRVMNIHPALLPSFPGTHVWQDQIDYGIKLAGCTVHFADEGTDTGPIIIQAAVPILDDDTADTLSARILKQEHRIYPKAIQLYAENRLRIEGRRVRVTPLDKSQDRVTIANPGLED